MSNILNIVNSVQVENNLKKHNIQGDFIAWEDTLYEAPLIDSISLEELSKIRAKYISQNSDIEYNKIYSRFNSRNSSLKKFKRYQKIYLWFEHDLYDQLQLIQILSWFAKYNSNENNLYIIYPENYLGFATKDELNLFFLYNREKVTHAHYIIAQKAYSALCSKEPITLYKLLYDDTNKLPYLKSVIKRLLQEYPNNKNGLSRT